MTQVHVRRDLAVLATIMLCVGALVAVIGPSRARAATPACTGSQLVETINSLNGGGTAGTDYYQLKFTNLGRACELRGYPGVSAVSISGRQMGRAAARQPGTEKTITLAAATSDSAHAAVETIGFVDTSALSGCDQHLAAGLRIYAPGSTTAKYVPFVFDACSTTTHAFLELKPIT